jgi:UDP:flavonoid glycosyltransferase YjiC (YdhE family)
MGMKILCIVFSPATGSFGSLTRLLALAREFSRKGHEVQFCASGSVGSMIAKKHFPVRTMPEPTLFGLPGAISRKIQKKSQHFRIPVKDGTVVGSVWFVYWLTGMLNRHFLGRLVDAQLKAIREYGPDLIVTEMDPGAYVAARIADIPIVTTYAKISEYGRGSRFWRKAKKIINQVLREHGVGEVDRPEELVSAGEKARILNIIPSVPALDGSAESDDVMYVGNILEPVRDERPTFSAAPGNRYIFVYSGIGSFPIDPLKKVLPAAFEGLSGVVCLVAAESLTKEERIGNVFFAPWIPAAEILPQCDLVICHGGLNTITQSIEAGVPLLVFPGPIFERRFNAEMLMKSGAGMMGEWSDFNAEWIRSQYDRRKDFTEGVQKLKKEFSRYSGTGNAVKRIIQWKEKQGA